MTVDERESLVNDLCMGFMTLGADMAELKNMLYVILEPYEITTRSTAVAKVTLELPDLENATGPARCITGQSGSGICGAAAYCDQPYDCCAQCSEDCNGRCGWIPRQGADQGPEEPLGHKTEPKRNPAMETHARMCLSNLQVEIGAKAWPAALASARHLVHYLSLVVGEAAEGGNI